jgi:hypothetical protein
VYRDVDALLIRATTHSTDIDLPAWPPLSDDAPEGWRTWLRDVWSRPAVAQAITVASPTLAAQVDRVCAANDVRDRRQLRRLVLATARYLLRMTGRSTPFGLFAGVATARVGSDPAVRWGGHHRPVIRPGTAWLDAVITALEGCPSLLRRLPVTLNNTARDDGEG